MAKNKTKKLLLPAAELIKQKKYDEAKEFLAPIDHPKAREWLAKVESRANGRPKRNLPEPTAVPLPAPLSELDVLIQDLHLKARGIWLLYVGLAASVVGLLALFLLIELSAPQSIQITLLELLLMAALLVVAFVLSAAAFGKWRDNQALTTRCQVVMQQRRVWGESVCRAILQKQIAPTMRADMVLLAWGKPHYIDDQEITKTGVEKERWVYTSPRLGVRYIYFKNGEVDKIKT